MWARGARAAVVLGLSRHCGHDPTVERRLASLPAPQFSMKTYQVEPGTQSN
jgi:hypothetical protein